MGIAFERESLNGVVKIIGMVVEAEGEAVNDLCWKLGGFGVPLFLRIALDKGGVKFPTDQRNTAFFQIGWSDKGGRRCFFCEEFPHAVRVEVDTEKTIHGVEIDRHGVDPVLMA